ncbi:MAG: putative C-S lyase [Verrucomicrobia bacterium]|nr:MAG: putative C-S lyase [Verrucomicrobiota bacterium]
MSFDFDTARPRYDTDSQKWQKYRGRDILPMWVADMDFPVAPAIVEAIRERTNDPIFGYCRPTDSLIEAVVEYLENRHNWTIDPEWLVWLPGLVPAINLACQAIGEPDDGVFTFTPVYPPFLIAPGLRHRELQTAALRHRENTWEIDWDATAAAITPRTRLLLLCNPHNPVGRVWRPDELQRIAEMAEAHDLVVCSDEIHCDLILDPIRHTTAGVWGRAVADRLIVLHAPSKTYNIAGLACSYAVIPNTRLRHALKRAAVGITGEVNNFGYVACEAAYRHGESWRQALLDRLRANRDLIEQTVAAGDLPGMHMTHVEATYLAWLNVEALKLEDPVRFFEEAGVGLSGGGAFGDDRYVRLNFACPESTLREALRRMKAALEKRSTH